MRNEYDRIFKTVMKRALAKFEANPDDPDMQKDIDIAVGLVIIDTLLGDKAMARIIEESESEKRINTRVANPVGVGGGY